MDRLHATKITREQQEGSGARSASPGPRLRVLIAGPAGGGRSATNIVGGNKLMIEESARELGRHGFEVAIVDTSGPVANLSPWVFRFFRLTRFAKAACGIAARARRFDAVMLVVAGFSANVAGTTAWIVCRIAGRRLVMRATGADLGLCYQRFGPFARRLADWTWMRSALVYVETRQLQREFAARPNVRWFPNTRNVQAPTTTRRRRPCRLVFLARLHMDKGLAEVLDACRGLPEPCKLDVFGPGTSDTDFSLFDDHPNATYRGVLAPRDVPRMLGDHDLLLAPSYCGREGYPGTILEAFQCGLPVVASDWGGVAELVEHEVCGLLVQPRSAEAVRTAVERLLGDPDLYMRLCQGARRQGERYRSTRWFERMASDLDALCDPR